MQIASIIKKSVIGVFYTIHYSLFTVHFLLLTASCFSQSGAAINTTGTAADASAILDASSQTQGMLIPRMTTIERDAIFNPAVGLQIFNTTTNCLEFFIGSTWQSLICGCISAPISPYGTNNIIGANYITWTWSSVAEAKGYKYNTVNDYNTAIENGSNTFYIQIGLTHSNTYTLYVWAYNSCGYSSSTQLIENTLNATACGIVSFDYNGTNVIYGTVNGQNGTCWLDRNLGASSVATAYNHSDAYGDLFQWGRLDDGHQVRTPLSGTTTTQSSTINPGHSNFIQNSSIWYIGPNPDNLWQGVSGVNNPCPIGWRLPTETELNIEISSWTGGSNYIGAIQSACKLPAAGFRNYSAGSLVSVDSNGRYWSSTISGTNVRGLSFSSSNAYMDNNNRANGFSVRCLRD